MQLAFIFVIPWFKNKIEIKVHLVILWVTTPTTLEELLKTKKLNYQIHIFKMQYLKFQVNQLIEMAM